VDNQEGNVAARSRVLFEQLRALRSKAPPEEPRHAPGEDLPEPEAPQDVEHERSSIGAGSDERDDVAVPPAPPPEEKAVVSADIQPPAGDHWSTGPEAASAPTAEGDRGRHPAADLPLPRVIAIANQKGGVGKTTTAVNLGAAIAELGYRTLIIDLDPQGNATTGLGVNARNLEHAIYDVLMHELPLDECVEPTSVRNLFVAPATIDLAGAEIELVPAFSRELRLRRAVADMGDDYDFTIIDCPPSLGLLTVNGLAAATEVIVPIQCEYYALEGLSQLLRNVSLVQSNLNPALIVSAIILTMYDARTKLADQVASEVRQHFGAKVCRNVVPRTVRLSEAPSFGQPIIVFDTASRGALAYRELAKEVSGGAPQRVR
jgi:chromosome partitioning protein